MSCRRTTHVLEQAEFFWPICLLRRQVLNKCFSQLKLGKQSERVSGVALQTGQELFWIRCFSMQPKLSFQEPEIKDKNAPEAMSTLCNERLIDELKAKWARAWVNNTRPQPFDILPRIRAQRFAKRPDIWRRSGLKINLKHKEFQQYLVIINAWPIKDRGQIRQNNAGIRRCSYLHLTVLINAIITRYSFSLFRLE